MIAKGIAEFLAAQGIGTLGADLFIRQMPDKPDDAVCLYDETGFILPESHVFDEDAFGLQVSARGSYSFARNKILEIHRTITNITGTFDGIKIRQTKIQTTPAFVETDEEGRAIYTAHYDHHCKIGQNLHRTP